VPGLHPALDRELARSVGASFAERLSAELHLGTFLFPLLRENRMGGGESDHRRERPEA
jgi:hypothetical protein